ncbi:hypothetical protein PGTUg99_028331 [Puccinia graminis f. sp. tritici]|uniref:Uncharacterized protein n=1 Tax=Puccinia graminis f. sp. tritici TaxID=56615 RepID=A0A5B0S1U3_PUCGR|nr:hypothetical protein PGTUg99_028331 [Puccinia graminis f. sp. tritici]
MHGLAISGYISGGKNGVCFPKSALCVLWPSCLSVIKGYRYPIRLNQLVTFLEFQSKKTNVKVSQASAVVLSPRNQKAPEVILAVRLLAEVPFVVGEVVNLKANRSF